MQQLKIALSSAHKKPNPRSIRTLLRCGSATMALCLSTMAAASPLSLAHARLLALERSRQLVAQDYTVAASRDRCRSIA